MPASRWHARIAGPEEHDVHPSSSYSPRRASLAIRWILIHLGVPMRNIEHRLSSPNVSFPPIRDVHGNRRQVLSDRQVTTHNRRSVSCSEVRLAPEG